MNSSNGGLFGSDEISAIVRAEVAAYHREDAVHSIVSAGTVSLLVLIGVAIFLKAGGVI